MAFFPGWPLILSLFGQLGVPVRSAECSFPWSALPSLLQRCIGSAGRGRPSRLFAPTAVFTMVPYTESLFCAVAFWAWERAVPIAGWPPSRSRQSPARTGIRPLPDRRAARDDLYQQAMRPVSSCAGRR